MKNKKWFDIYGDGPTDKGILLAKVRGKGLAYLVGVLLKTTYSNVKVI